MKLLDKITKPEFNFILRNIETMNYYLFNDYYSVFDKALELSKKNIYNIYLIHKVFKDRCDEYRYMQEYKVVNGKIYDETDMYNGLHCMFFINAGEWLNKEQA